MCTLMCFLMYMCMCGGHRWTLSPSPPSVKASL